MRFNSGNKVTTSADEPEFEIAMTTSFLVIMPKIAMASFARVYKECWGASAGEGGGNLSADVARLTHSSNNNSVLAI